ncbi:hypothetical protein PR048_005609 [Dryococelus australis]|uniref:Transposase n=1 Tax=Dryococelus australis TaxID=614101 RepID=A0ABQ9I8Q8_9NEOP|nr:hypothetical protein PR048_005609 [Dryococelus australis]
MDSRLHETGSLQVSKHNQKCAFEMLPIRLEETWLKRIVKDPGTSTRIIAGQLRTSHTIVWKVERTQLKCLSQDKSAQAPPTGSWITQLSIKTGYSSRKITSTGLFKTLIPPTNMANKKNLSKVLPELLKDVPLETRIQHDSTPAHSAVKVRNYLYQIYPNL